MNTTDSAHPPASVPTPAFDEITSRPIIEIMEQHLKNAGYASFLHCVSHPALKRAVQYMKDMTAEYERAHSENAALVAERDTLAKKLSDQSMSVIMDVDEFDALEAKAKEADTLRSANAELASCLSELTATVKGECPSLLDEDSGGCARLDMAIEAALATQKAGGAMANANKPPGLFTKQKLEEINAELRGENAAMGARLESLESQHKTRLAAFEEYKKLRDAQLAQAEAALAQAQADSKRLDWMADSYNSAGMEEADKLAAMLRFENTYNGLHRMGQENKKAVRAAIDAAMSQQPGGAS
jgi:hypothetical protein